MPDFAALNTELEVCLPAGSAPVRTTVQVLLAQSWLRAEVTVVAVKW